MRQRCAVPSLSEFYSYLGDVQNQLGPKIFWNRPPVTDGSIFFRVRLRRLTQSLRNSRTWSKDRCGRQPGTVATCCKLSTGAVLFGWKLSLRGWVRPPDMKNGDGLKLTLLIRYFIGALSKCQKNASLRSRFALKSGVQGCSSNPSEGKFLAILHSEISR